MGLSWSSQFCWDDSVWGDGERLYYWNNTSRSCKVILWLLSVFRLLPFFVDKFDRDFICSQPEDDGMTKCNEVPNYRHMYRMCNDSAAPFSNNTPTNQSCVNWNQYYTVCKNESTNPFQGTISFDNIGLAWIAIFQVGLYNQPVCETVCLPEIFVMFASGTCSSSCMLLLSLLSNISQILCCRISHLLIVIECQIFSDILYNWFLDLVFVFKRLVKMISVYSFLLSTWISYYNFCYGRSTLLTCYD